MHKFVISYYKYFERSLTSNIFIGENACDAVKKFFNSSDYQLSDEDIKKINKFTTFAKIKEFILFKYKDHIEIIKV